MQAPAHKSSGYGRCCDGRNAATLGETSP